MIIELHDQALTSKLGPDFAFHFRTCHSIRQLIDPCILVTLDSHGEFWSAESIERLELVASLAGSLTARGCGPLIPLKQPGRIAVLFVRRRDAACGDVMTAYDVIDPRIDPHAWPWKGTARPFGHRDVTY